MKFIVKDGDKWTIKDVEEVAGPTETLSCGMLCANAVVALMDLGPAITAVDARANKNRILDVCDKILKLFQDEKLRHGEILATLSLLISALHIRYTEFMSDGE